jgi:3-oxoacyl-[acyl-carrier-protein] synthase-3
MIRSVVIGSGSALPLRAVSNAELAETVDTSDEWIVERTGIRNRHIAGEGETTATLAAEASRQALAAAGIDPDDIGLIVLATATPDQTFPATATRVQDILGCHGGVAFDVAAVCSGFLYALATADSLLRTGMAKRALVLEAREVDEAGPGILYSKLHADGAHNELLYVDGGPSTTGTVGKLRMKGREVVRHAVTNLAQVLETVLAETGFSISQIDWVVPHQANARILDATARKLGLPADKVVMTVDRHANTSAASVPLAFDTAVRDGRIKPGDLVMLEAMGGGFTWGASLLRM